ncbi:cation:proton antiporter [Chakrabartyella piscis]|uniref:cation:proton antiporter n=1 Tax=Chakrabartyella piscis TaxID=2918914 RepID=UPI0029584641|nr:cation:proton antiporter [Chakrabartyella piscis]
MESYSFLFDLAIIILTTKALGIISNKFHMPQVVGALLAGLVFGPACIGVIQNNDFIEITAELGVVVLMFSTGMETDIKELKESGKSSFFIALCGVLVPLIGGFLVAQYFNQPDRIPSDASSTLFLQNLFIGVILTATSVSITVETLKELGRLKTRSGNAILGAAIIDDILGIVALTVITSFTDSSVNIVFVLLKILAFFLFAAVAGVCFYKLYSWWSELAHRELHRHVVFAFAFCLLMAYCAEELFGVADITGAFIAGLVLSGTKKSHYIAAKFDVLSYLYLSPIFFASIGLKVALPEMTGTIVAFSLVLVVVAVLTKIVGCGVGAKICGLETYESQRVGVGMVSRGEVALIVASKGAALGLLGSDFIGPIVIMVVITTVITPILLKIVYKKDPDMISTIDDDGFAKNYEIQERLRQFSQTHSKI